jgi:hypothetical protein
MNQLATAIVDISVGLVRDVAIADGNKKAQAISRKRMQE